jgi:hypothetical protein
MRERDQDGGPDFEATKYCTVVKATLYLPYVCCLHPRIYFFFLTHAAGSKFDETLYRTYDTCSNHMNVKAQQL